MKEDIIIQLITNEEFKRESNCGNLTQDEFKNYLSANFSLEDLEQMLEELKD